MSQDEFMKQLEGKSISKLVVNNGYVFAQLENGVFWYDKIAKDAIMEEDVDGVHITIDRMMDIVAECE